MKRVFLAMMILAACGGTAVIDGGSGGSGGTHPGGGAGPVTGTTAPVAVGTTGSGAGGATPTCEELTQTMLAALDDAKRCDACGNGPNPCVYLSGPQLTDACGCPSPVNAASTDKVATAVSAQNAWRLAGCGPLDCDQPCAVSNTPSCHSVDGCDGRCAP